MTFLFQLGVLRDAVSTPVHALTLAHLKDLAVRFVNDKVLSTEGLVPVSYVIVWKGVRTFW